MSTPDHNLNAARRAEIISQALPYIRSLSGQTIVVKYGGAAMTDENLKTAVMGDIALLHYVGVKVIVVHGGGPEISAMCAQVGIEPKFINGMRVTDSETMRVTEMVLGQIGKSIAHGLSTHGAPSVGLSGKDGNFLRAKKFVGEADWGLVGEVDCVEPQLLNTLAREGFVPVVSPVAPGKDGETYNINADYAASAIAGATGAIKVLFLTDVAGVLRDASDASTLIASISTDEVENLIDQKIIAGGMIPKVRCCTDAIFKGVEKAHIVDGREPHALLVELFTPEGCGTMIQK